MPGNLTGLILLVTEVAGMRLSEILLTIPAGVNGDHIFSNVVKYYLHLYCTPKRSIIASIQTKLTVKILTSTNVFQIRVRLTTVLIR